MEKITYLGEQIYPRARAQKRSRNGRWISRAWYRIKVACAVLAMLVIAAGIGGGIVWESVRGQTVKNSSTDISGEVAKLSAAEITARQNEALEFLAGVEGVGASPIQYDNTKDGRLAGIAVASVGDFRFKVPTVQLWAKQLQGKSLSELDAVYLALDHEKSKELARQVIFYSKIDWSSPSGWFSSSQKTFAYHGQKMTLEEIVKSIKTQMN